MTAAQFREECRKYAKAQVEAQKADFKRLGVIGDWDHPYLTMNFETEANIIRCLGKIIKNGYFVRGFKPVNWCCDCGSALAEAEVEYKDIDSLAIDSINNAFLGDSLTFSHPNISQDEVEQELSGKKNEEPLTLP